MSNGSTFAKVVRALRAIVFVFFALGPLLFYSPLLLMVPQLTLMFIHYGLYRRYIDFVTGGYCDHMGALVGVVLGCRPVLSGDNLTRVGERALIISNHRTRLDWMFLWGWIPHEGRNTNLKLMLKQELKKFPMIGWPMQESMFWFLSRNWKVDQPNIDRMLRHNHNKKYPVQLLIFPEGTDKTEYTTRRSDEFAAKNNLEPLKHLLYPRETGFVYVAKALRELGDIDAVYDVTLAYSPTVPQTELSVFTGFPTEFHVNIRRFDLEDVPREDAELSKWLRQRWIAKEKLLEEFSKSKTLGDSKSHIALNPNANLREYAYLALWSVLVPLAAYLFATNSIVFYTEIFLWVLMTIGSLLGGFDLLEVKYCADVIADPSKIVSYF
jgi:lysocardiolipin and lysophospholipid acyltransferase